MISWSPINDDLINEIVDFVGDGSVLEVFAGNGELGRRLMARSINVHSTSAHLAVYDGEGAELPIDVEQLNAVDACKKYRDSFDYLLAAWPIADDTLLHCALVWDKPVIVVGELWHEHPLNTYRVYSGTGSDSYFKNVVDIREPVMCLGRASAAVMFHRLKDTLCSDFSPYLLSYEWASPSELRYLYSQKCEKPHN